MTAEECSIKGAFVFAFEKHADERGTFNRVWCSDSFREAGIGGEFVQCNISTNHQAGTLRGMHYQREPNAEAKIVRCIRGRIFDVLLDLRADSPSYGKWEGFELSDSDPAALFIPEGVAHGFLTREDDSELLYLMSTYYSSGDARGVRWNDPAFSIEWPFKPVIISQRDQDFPDYVNTGS